MAWRVIQSEENEELATAIKTQLVNCIGFDGDELAESRKDSYDYYFQRRRGDEVPGRSQIVSGDISSMVEANLAQMAEPLLNKRIAEFCAYDADDEDQAQLESDCVYEMLFKRQSGFIEVASAIKDALLIRNAVIKVYVDERTHVTQVNKRNVDPIALDAVLQQIGDTQVHQYNPNTRKFSATVTKVTREFCVDAVAPENFLYPKGWHRQDLKGIPFCAERHVEPRSTLIERNFPKDIVKNLRRWNNPYQAASDARLPRQMTPHRVSIDSAADEIEWYECYVKVDDGTGAAELRRVSYSCGYILEDIPADLVTYATGTAIINPHSFMGISLFDKLKSTQDSTTALTRALMDNINTVNKNRTAHLDGVVEDQDLTDGRTNGSIRVNPERVQDVRQAITAFQVPDASGNILLNLDHMRKVRSEMGGASLDMSAGNVQLNERVGSLGLDRAYSVMEALAALMTRFLAHTLIRSMYLIAHEVLRTQWKQPIAFKRGKTWLRTNPAEWKVRDAITINLGASIGERMRMAAVLEKVLDKQIALAQHGMEGVLIDVQGFYSAVMEWLRVCDISHAEKYFIDPRTPEAQKALKQRAIDSQRAQQKQDALINSAVALEQLRTAMDKYKHDSEMQFKYFAEVLGVQVDEAKLTLDGITKFKELASQMFGRNDNDSDDTGRAKEGSKGVAE